jgi:hypothetical protein
MSRRGRKTSVNGHEGGRPARPRRAITRLMQCSKNQHFAQLVPLSDRLRSLAEDGDGFTIVPRAEAFGNTIHDLAQPILGTATIVDPSES